MTPQDDEAARKIYVAEGGYALLEALVAFIIVALGLAFTFRAIGQSADSARLSHERLAAVAHAESLMALIAAGAPVAAAGRIDDIYAWRLSLAPASSSATGLTQVRLHVEWGPSTRLQRVSLTTLRLSAPSR
ncbi:MAG: hypothetical protein NW215_03890 [Hyphomicrobiales bacterium]|nr:hypothetical protein [Hyphomicrobiales bacterium]